jgi:hypothetical protein
MQNRAGSLKVQVIKRDWQNEFKSADIIGSGIQNDYCMVMFNLVHRRQKKTASFFSGFSKIGS